MLHKTNLVTTTGILFIDVNSSMKDIHLRKGEMLGFLQPTDIDSSDLTTEAIYKTAFQNNNYSFFLFLLQIKESTTKL